MAIQIAMPEMFGLGEYVAPAAQGMHLEAEEDHRRWELIGDPVVLYDPPPICEEHDHLLVGWEEAFCPFC